MGQWVAEIEKTTIRPERLGEVRLQWNASVKQIELVEAARFKL